jgi:thiamine-monophosphate kinase
LVSGTHFTRATPPAALGYKLLAVNLSDLAAMGAEPQSAALSIVHDADPAWLDALLAGCEEMIEAHRLATLLTFIAAGPTTLTAQLYGTIPSREVALTRSGARPGEAVLVTGTLGDSGAALDADRGALRLTPDQHVALRRKFLRPEPRVREGIAARGIATAAIDISDGLGADLGHVLDASGVGAVIETSLLPISTALREAADARTACSYALSGGEDYELCLVCPEHRVAELVDRIAEQGTRVTRIGHTTAERGLRCLADGAAIELPHAGYRHF